MSFKLERDLVLVAGAKAISLLGDELAAIALLLRLQAHGAGPAAVAALLIANLAPIVLLSALVGRLVDQVDSRVLLTASSLAQAAACTVLASLSGTGVVLALVALLGAGQAVNGATWHSLVPAIVAPADLPRALSLTQIGTTTAGIVAPALGGLLTAGFGARVPLLVDAATFLAVTAAALLVRTRRRPAARPAGRVLGGFAIVRADELLRPLFALLALTVVLGSMVNVVDVFLVRETLHASTIWYGLSGAAYSAGALGGAVLGGRLVAAPPTLARAFVYGCAVLGLGLAAMAAVPSVGWLLPVGFGTGVANGTVNVTLAALVMGRARPAERGRVAAVLTGIASGTQIAAFVIGGALAGLLTPREVFALGGGLGLLAPMLLGRALLRAARHGAADCAASPSEGDTACPLAGESSPPAASPGLSPTT